MPTLNWNLDTNLVTAQAFDQSALQFQDTRGSVALRVICTRGDVNSGSQVLIAADQTVGIVLRDPGNFKGAGYLAGPTTFTRGTTAADGYIATVSTDTSVVREIMHVDDTAPEVPEYPVNAVLYYEPTSGGDALESLPFAWTILPRYYEPGTPPADIVAVWSSPAQLQAAIAAAAAAQPKLPTPTAIGQFLFGNPDGSVSWGALPSTLSPTFVNVTAATFSGSGASLTQLNPAALSGPVGLAFGGTGSTSAPAALTALGAEAAANKGAANGYAPLDGTQKIPAANLPSYVDDVLEAANFAALPSPGETGKIYVTLDTNFEYRWSGSTYIRIVSSPGTTDALAEGSANLYFTGARAVAAVGGSLHPVSYPSTPVGPSGNGTTIAFSGGASQLVISGAATTVRQNFISDTSGTLLLSFSANAAAGTLVATITLANAYTTTPGNVLFHRVDLAGGYTAAAVGGGSGVPALNAYFTGSTLQIYAAGDGVASGSRLGYQYYIPPV